MRRLLLPLLLLFPVPGMGKDLEELPPEAAEMFRSLAEVESFTVEFALVSDRALFTEPVTSTGRMVYQKPDRMRWSLQEPEPMEFLLTATHVALSSPGFGVQQIPLEGDPATYAFVKAMTVWMGGDLEAAKEDFDISWVPGPHPQAILVPRKEAISWAIQRIELTFGQSPIHVSSMVLALPGGDKTEYTFREYAAGPVDPGLFQLKDVPR
jgi:hypothetical protein